MSFTPVSKFPLLKFVGSSGMPHTDARVASRCICNTSNRSYRQLATRPNYRPMHSIISCTMQAWNRESFKGDVSARVASLLQMLQGHVFRVPRLVQVCSPTTTIPHYTSILPSQFSDLLPYLLPYFYTIFWCGLLCEGCTACSHVICD